MAEVNTGEGGGKKRNKSKTKKMSTKVDMTPMVDLAFLLITFFMLTTTFNKPQTMEVNMPDKTEDNKTMDLKESKALTIILGEDNKLYWYVGLQDPKVEVSDYSSKGIRKLLQTKKSEVPDMVVVIKAMEKSRYKNMVDILDEMHISEIKRYAITDITPVDLELLEKI
ncbi:biopolymer transporter ExbD [Cytophagaceae bacterium ABcell3]|nr:biopolymer transporter ExbD [Cytophagaceae bacterium ABcell3]